MSIIVVEGCDGSGKTTLIEQAREGHRERYFLTVRASRYPPDIKTALQYLQWIKHQREVNLVLDRIHFISDRVYGPLLRNENLFADFPIKFGLEDVAVVVYARPPIETIRKNCQKNFQMSGVERNLDQLLQRYDDLIGRIEKVGVRVMQYDYTSDDPKVFWRTVWKGAEK